MKLLYAILLLLAVIQLVLVKPLGAASRATPAEQYFKFWNKELDLLANDSAVKLKTMSDQILQDRLVQQAATPLMRDLKSNITYFQEFYPIYMQYGLKGELLYIFSEIINYYYQESVHVSQLMEKLGYSKMIDEYESSVRKSFFTKLLPKLKEIKNHFSNSRWNKLMKWAKTLEECEDYICFSNKFNSFYDIIFTPKEALFQYIQDEEQANEMYTANNATSIAKVVLQDKRLSQLSSNVRQQLTRNITEYIRQYESNHDVDKVHRILLFFYDTILKNVYSNDTRIPLKDKELLVKIFNEQGSAHFEANYRATFINFMKGDFIEEFARFRKALSKEELAKEKAILSWYDNFKSLTAAADISNAYRRLYNYK